MPANVMRINYVKNWRQLILDYISRDITPDNKMEEKEIRTKATWYTAMNGKIYHKSIDEGTLKGTCLPR